MDLQQVAIYGAGGFAREVAWLLESDPEKPVDIVCFIDDNAEGSGSKLNDIPVLDLAAAKSGFPDAKVVGGIGNPGLREKVINKAKTAGFDFYTAIHPNVVQSRWIEIGTGVVICAGNILTTNIEIHDHVQINLDCTIGHDVIMGKFATLAPGVHVSGNVHIHERAYIGTGANIINGRSDAPLIIEKDSVIGAGACVTKSVPAGTTVVGVPAKPINKGK